MVDRDDRLAGNVLIAASLLSVLAMTHHPTSFHATGMGRFIHAAMILLIAAMGYGLLHVALRRGIGRPAILAGAISWCIGLFGHVGAATINGFVVTGLAAKGIDNHDLFALAWGMNQALAQLGVIASGIAYLLWSLDWAREAGWKPKTLGAIGMLAGVVPIALLTFGAVRMNLAGAMLVYGVHELWIALAGLYVRSGGLNAMRGM